MSGNVVPMRVDADPARCLTAAHNIRGADCVDAADLADLVAAVGSALHSVHHPPMTEAEMWRWSGVVAHTRRIARKWTPR